MEQLFFASEELSEIKSNEGFSLHEHDYYEVYLFLEGDTKYVVEGNEYFLKPYDIILIKKNEMHRAYHNNPSTYHRIYLHIFPEFFEHFQCSEYEEKFLDFTSGNKIDSSIVISNGLADAIFRLKKYTNDFQDMNSSVARAILLEILYLIHNVDKLTKADRKNVILQGVIDYINIHYAEDITLQFLEDKFFVSKNHLCYLFRTETGLTVHQYLTRRRLAEVRGLLQKGMNIAEISSKVGFKTYSGFYRAYTNVYGHAPLESRKKEKKGGNVLCYTKK